MDVDKLGSVLAVRDLDEIRDNRTDDDQPDLETDDSSGGGEQLQLQQRMKPDTSLEAITEATDITTPVEMQMREATCTNTGGMAEAGADHTSAQISDLSEMPHEEEEEEAVLLSSDGTAGCRHPQQPVSETLFDITDPEEDEEEEEDEIEDHIGPMSQTRTGEEEAISGGSERSERTLMVEAEEAASAPPAAAAVDVQLRIQKRQGQIDRKFERLSQELSFELPAGVDSSNSSSSLTGCGKQLEQAEEEEEEFVRVASQLSQREEEEAAASFDQVVMDNFAEDKSEDWKLSNEEATPDMELNPGAIFGAAEMMMMTDQGESEGNL